MRKGTITERVGRCQGCPATFGELRTAKRHVDRTGHTVLWDVVYRRWIVSDLEVAP